MNTKKRAIFIDRDGVLNDIVDRGENFFVGGVRARFGAPSRYSEFRLISGVHESLEILGTLGLLRILATNQPDIAYGILSQTDHERIMQEVKALPLDDIFVCLHKRDDGCLCKKPKPGMLLDAADKWNIDLASSFMIGDTKDDVEAARAVGCATVIVDCDYNKEVEADIRVGSLLEAARSIKQSLTLKA